MIRTLATIPLLVFAFWLGGLWKSADYGRDLMAAYKLGVKETTWLVNVSHKAAIGNEE